MKKSPKFIRSDRRGFLKGSALAGAAAVTASPTVLKAETLEPEAPVVKADKGYEENDYIRSYYETARF